MLGLHEGRRRLPAVIGVVASGALGLAGLALAIALSDGVHADARAEGPPAAPAPAPAPAPPMPPEEAPAGFNARSNGFEPQAAFDKDRIAFEKVEGISSDGLGPVYNGTSCVGCHQDPITGSSSQNTELRVGHEGPDPDDSSKMKFFEPPSGSLIHQRAIDAAIQEHVLDGFEVRTLRLSSSLLGDGFIEVIPDAKLCQIRDAQPASMQGLAIVVPVPIGLKPKSTIPFDFEMVEKIGRFGWKCQEASLINFSAGAYLNEMGVTSPLQPKENTSNGRSVAPFDVVGDPEDLPAADDTDTAHPFGEDIKAFTQFIRTTQVPPRDFEVLGLPDVIEGEKLFRDNALLGCAICHQPDYTTPLAGSPIKPYHDDGSGKPGSDMATVPPALGNKIIHPFGDFLLHDVGTGDGIAQTQHAQKPPRGIENLIKTPDSVLLAGRVTRVKATARAGKGRILSPDPTGLDQRTVNMIRTAPLWGLRVRPQMLHDGSAITIDEAIRRHKGQATDVTAKYLKLTPQQSGQLLAFLRSL